MAAKAYENVRVLLGVLVVLVLVWMVMLLLLLLLLLLLTRPPPSSSNRRCLWRSLRKSARRSRACS